MSEKHDLTKTKIVVEKPSVNHTSLEDWINNNDEIIGFIGWVEVDESVLDEYVPESFPHNKKISEDEDGNPIYDEDGNPVLEQRTFRDYVGGLYHESINEGKILIPIGERDKNGNRLTIVEDNEFKIWVNYFGIDYIKTKSEGKALIKIEESESE